MLRHGIERRDAAPCERLVSSGRGSCAGRPFHDAVITLENTGFWTESPQIELQCFGTQFLDDSCAFQSTLILEPGAINCNGGTLIIAPRLFPGSSPIDATLVVYITDNNASPPFLIGPLVAHFTVPS